MPATTKILQLEVRAVNKVGGPLAAAGSSLIGLMGAATGAGAALAIAGAALIAVGVGAIAAAAKIWSYVEDSVEAAALFESKMAILDVAAKRLDLTVSNLAGETLESLHDVMLQVGLDTRLFGVDANEATDATTEFVKAGLSEAEMFGDLQGYISGTTELTGGLRAAIDLATASELNHEESARFASIALATYGYELESATARALFMTDAVDTTVRAADASTASVTGLTEGLIAFGPVASMFGVNLEDSNTLLAILSDRGIEGSEAGTALRSMFNNLIRDTAKQNELFELYNINLYDANGEMLSAVEIVGQFETALVGLTDKEADHLIKIAAGTYGQKALNALLIEGTEGWTAMEQKIADASSVTEVASARINTLSGDQEILGGQMQTTSIIIGEMFIPIWRQMIQWFTTLMEKHGPAIMTIFQGIARGVGVVADLVTGPLSAALGGLLGALGYTTEAGNDTAEMWGFLIGKFIEVTSGGLIALVVMSVNTLTAALDTGNRVVGWFKEKFEGLERVLWRVQNALKWVRDWIDAVVTSFRNLNIPDWLRPGSPAPLETALWGIGAALKALPELSVPITAEVAGAVVQMTTGGEGSAGAARAPVIIHNHFGRDSVRSDQDIIAIADAQQRAMELRGVRGRIL